MSRSHRRLELGIPLVVLLSGSSCGTAPEPAGELAPAFAEFDSVNVSVVLAGDRVTIESNGLPNHTSPYWSPDHPLFVEPTVTTRERMVPGYIDDSEDDEELNGSYTLTISASPQLASRDPVDPHGPANDPCRSGNGSQSPRHSSGALSTDCQRDHPPATVLQVRRHRRVAGEEEDLAMFRHPLQELEGAVAARGVPVDEGFVHE